MRMMMMMMVMMVRRRLGDDHLLSVVRRDSSSHVGLNLVGGSWDAAALAVWVVRMISSFL
jgi:hypothetical protein